MLPILPVGIWRRRAVVDSGRSLGRNVWRFGRSWNNRRSCWIGRRCLWRRRRCQISQPWLFLQATVINWWNRPVWWVIFTSRCWLLVLSGATSATQIKGRHLQIFVAIGYILVSPSLPLFQPPRDLISHSPFRLPHRVTMTFRLPISQWRIHHPALCSLWMHPVHPGYMSATATT